MSKRKNQPLSGIGNAIEKGFFTAFGRIVNERTKKGIPGLKIEAWDKDLLFNQRLGYAMSNEEGEFRINFDEIQFRNLFFDKYPDVFFKVFRGNKLLKNTKDSVLWNVGSKDQSGFKEIAVRNIYATDTSRNIFKFISLRSRDSNYEDQNQEFASSRLLIHPIYDAKQVETGFYNSLLRKSEGNGSLEATKKELNDFKDSPDFVNTFDDLHFDLLRVDNWLKISRYKGRSQMQLEEDLSEVLGQPLEQVVKDETFKKTKTQLADSIVCCLLSKEIEAENFRKTIYLYKLLGLVEVIADQSFKWGGNNWFDEFYTNFKVRLPVDLNRMLKRRFIEERKSKSGQDINTEKESFTGEVEERAKSGKGQLLKIGDIILKKGMIQSAFRESKKRLSFLLPNYNVGVGDLLVVRQKIRAYELGEFAHIENALSGETRERTHRKLNRREELFIETTETETETERDLQSTERYEVQTEAEERIKKETQIQAGAQISGSYGPSISFSANFQASHSGNSENYKRKATNFSREVIDRSVERIQEKIHREFQRKILEEIEETNLHRIDNSNGHGKHVRGIYRWLNKIYDAQVFKYGQRMMFEFLIPEPAKFFLETIVEDAEEITPQFLLLTRMVFH